MLLVAQVNISCRYPISFELPVVPSSLLYSLLHLSITSFPLRLPSGGHFPLKYQQCPYLSIHTQMTWFDSIETNKSNSGTHLRHLMTTHKNGLCNYRTTHALLGLFALVVFRVGIFKAFQGCNSRCDPQPHFR